MWKGNAKKKRVGKITKDISERHVNGHSSSDGNAENATKRRSVRVGQKNTVHVRFVISVYGRPFFEDLA